MLADHIVGHRRQCMILSDAVDKGRMANAYLFSGADGLGKKFIAVQLAKTLNCQSPRDGSPCEECESCRKVNSGSHPDVLVISPKGKERIINVAMIGEMLQRVSRKSYEGRYKIIIFDDAHRMRESASSKLLKTLEEPPPRTVMILVTSRPDKMLPTIVSRCQTVNFYLLPDKEIEDFLVRSKKIPFEEARVIASFAGGRVSESLKLLSDETVRRRNSYLNYIQSAIKGDLAGLFNIVSGIDAEFKELLDRNMEDIKREKETEGYENAKEIKELIEAEAFSSVQYEKEEMLLIWQVWFRDMLLIKECGTAVDIMNKDSKEMLAHLSAERGFDEILNCIKAVEHARDMIRFNINFQLVMEEFFIEVVKNIGRKGVLT
ncbi:MAG: DNA polymerase III subunit delta' [Candidatus Aureabacteria bacterium]|nr:DNA polymerase III subunit delta' [Candidatus Auribacterota bacterium]